MEESKNGLLKRIIDVLGILEATAKNEMHLRELVLCTGWDLDELAGFNLNDLSQALAPLSADLQVLLTYIEEPPDSFAEIDEVYDKAQAAFGRLAQLKKALENLDLEGPDKDKLLEFGQDLLNILITIYLKTQSPIAFHILHLLTIVDFDDKDLEPIAASNGKLVRYPCLVPKLKPGRLSDVFSDTVNYFGQYYFPNGLHTDGDALMAAHKLFPRVANILQELGINTQMGFSSRRGVDLGIESNELANGMFTIFFEPDFEGIDFGLSMILSPASRGNLGLVVIPFGNLKFSKIFNSWQFNFDLTGGTKGFALGPEGATLLAEADSTQVSLNLQLVKLAATEGQPAFLLGGRSGSRLEIGTLTFEAGIGLDEAEFEIDLLLQVNKGMFVLMPGDGDGFLAKVLPPEGIQLDFDLGLGWSKRDGLYFKGSAGLEAEYNFHQSFLGILKLQSIRLKLSLSGSALSFIADAALEVRLGPVTAIIQQIGIQTDTSFVTEGGNAGIANNKISFKPPSGVGLSIDAGGIKGGGFLKFDPEQGEYFGAMELEFKDMFSMKAFGIINTKMPDGSDGFSLLIVITAEFTPIQLGFGFTLNGIGGLLGVNRTVKVEVLKEGIKTNSIKSILFPENVVANINRIVSDIKQVFPPQKDHFLICPMGKIGWGTPTIITLDLGILIEIPATGFKILGVLKALLPQEDNALLKLQVNFLGVIDFENRSISFDATLFESRLLTYTITGDMALRIAWGDKPNFILSVGGFHPAFKDVPGDLKKMQRITVSLYSSDKARITVQSYFAVTSNTVQFGARAELFAGNSGGFNIYGFIGYDVLFQFNPFHFIADFSAGIALRRRTSVYMGIRVSGQLSGPSPWDVKGEASISFFFFSISVSFHETWGDSSGEVEASKADLIQMLTAEIKDDRNWKADIPPNNSLHVSIKKIVQTEGATIVHPFGILTFSERLAPLELEINKFGNKVPKDANRFEIKTTDSLLTTQQVREQFAPANFLEMSDAEKLARSSFEQMKSGFKITGSGALQTPAAVNKSVDYELSYLRKKRSRLFYFGSYKYGKAFFKNNIKGGAASVSALSYINKRISVNAPEKVMISEQQYVIANISDMKLHSEEIAAGSYTEAVQFYNELVNKQPNLKEQVQVVSQYELN